MAPLHLTAIYPKTDRLRVVSAAVEWVTTVNTLVQMLALGDDCYALHFKPLIHGHYLPRPVESVKLVAPLLALNSELAIKNGITTKGGLLWIKTDYEDGWSVGDAHPLPRNFDYRMHAINQSQHSKFSTSPLDLLTYTDRNQERGKLMGRHIACTARFTPLHISKYDGKTYAIEGASIIGVNDANDPYGIPDEEGAARNRYVPYRRADGQMVNPLQVAYMRETYWFTR